MAKGTKVEAIRHHTFAGKDYAPGETYTVNGDEFQTVDQYVDTLRGSGLAKVAGEDGPNIVEEIGEQSTEPSPAPTRAGSTEVAPRSTEDVPVKPAKAARTKSTSAKARKK